MSTPRAHLTPLVVLLLLTALARLPIASWRLGDLADDRDDYRQLADGLADGNGLVDPDQGTPTAYRAPLYPLWLAATATWTDGDIDLLAGHFVLGCLAVLGTWQLGRQLGLGRRAAWPAVAVAVDPLLVVSATIPMTETLYTALATWMLVGATAAPSPKRGLGLGMLFGLAALCRPTTWAVAVTALLFLIAGRLRGRSSSPWISNRKNMLGMVVGVCVVVGPWIARNAAHSGSLVLTTTHGGYTLLLGNNPTFYDQVVNQPLGTTWHDETSESGQRPVDWRRELEGRLPGPRQGITSERLRDHMMYRMAWTHITDDAGGFGRACLLRIARFWTPIPFRSDWPGPLVLVVAAWYILTLLALVAGLWRLSRNDTSWLAPLAFLLAIALVHVVFWSTMRMRAPIMPVVYLIGASGWSVRASTRLIDTPENPDL